MDTLFKALADPARLALMDSLRRKDGQSLSDLEGQLDMTRFGVMKHLRVLEDASLIVTRKVGRFKYHYLNALPLQEAIDRFIDPYRAAPAARAMIDLKTQLEGTAPMKPDFVMQTYIRCTQDALWQALTDPDAAPHFHFLASRVARDGNRLIYFTPDDARMLVCTETALTPKSRIESTFEPAWAGPDMQASRFVYSIEAEGALCKLTLEHFDIPADQAGVADGWARMLSGLKTWLETGTPARFGLQAAS